MLGPWEATSVLTNVILFLAAGFLCIYSYFKFSYTYWARKQVPYLTPTFPLGNNKIWGPLAFTYGLEARDWYNAFKKMGVKCGGVWNFYHKALVLVDTTLIKDVMTKDFNVFINRDVFHNPEYEPKGEHLFVTENEEWRYMRHKMTPAFTTAKMRYMFDCVLKSSDLLVDLVEKVKDSNGDIQLRLLLDKYTMDNIGSVAFGLNFNCLLSEDTKFRQVADTVLKPHLLSKLKRLSVRIVPNLARKLGLSLADSHVIDFFADMITNNVEQRRQTNVKRNDFTQLLMDIQEASQKENSRFTTDDLIANCIVFFFAGFDTSSKTMQFTLFELARNQDIQDKVRNEIKTTLGNYKGQLTYEGYKEMTYLRQVIDETLRMYPPVLTLSRVCQQEYKFKSSDTVIEKGTTVLIPAMGLHWDPNLFPNPEKYDPDRFSPANKPNIVPYSYLPFGEGPRNCIGRRFGSMQSAIGLIQILNNYKIETSPRLELPLEVQHGQFLLETQDVYVRASRL